MPVATAIILADPCADCGTDEGDLNTGNVRPARLSAERFGFPPGSRICKSCYQKWLYRVRRPLPRSIRCRQRVWRAA